MLYVLKFFFYEVLLWWVNYVSNVYTISEWILIMKKIYQNGQLNINEKSAYVLTR